MTARLVDPRRNESALTPRAEPGAPIRLGPPLLARESGEASPPGPRIHSHGLAGRLLVLTIGSVLIGFAAVYITRLAAFHENWLTDKISDIRTATLIASGSDDGAISPIMAGKILDASGAKSIVLNSGGRRVTIGAAEVPAQAGDAFDLRDPSMLEGLRAAARALFAPPGAMLKVIAHAPANDGALEVTMDETPLTNAMWRFSRVFLTISLTVCAITTTVLWFLIWLMVLRPVRRLTSNIMAFGEGPEDERRIIAPSRRRDEIGGAERALAAMQRSLAQELGQKKRLAELGLAVARINHDLRNMLSAAQLISDRLAGIPDPLAMRLAPRLVATLDRAIAFCQSTLTYGGAVERAPVKRRFALRGLVEQVVETAKAGGAGEISFEIAIESGIELFADPDHVTRALENLNRNAVQALTQAGPGPGRTPAVRYSALRTPEGVTIEIADTGPGFPARLSLGAFEPFHLSTREGGSGLGLAITADLIEKNGGSISLAPAQSEAYYCGARFDIHLPSAIPLLRKVELLSPKS